MNKKLNSFLVATLFTFAIFGGGISVSADSAPGDVIISLGENLSPAQKEQMLKEMNAPENALMVTVSNQEEHKALGEFIPKAQIGTRSLSSAKIEITEKGSGIVVESNNINWVSNEMFTNALATAGVKDAKVYVTAPFEVSGTAGLTGVIKAYETSTGEKISEENKQMANEEMVTIAQLGEQIGQEEASALATAVKDELAQNMPKDSAEMQQLIEQKAEELNIPIDATQLQDLTGMYDKMKEIDINWNAVGDQISAAQEKLEGFINSEEGKNFFASVGQFVKDVFQAIVDFFSSLFGSK